MKHAFFVLLAVGLLAGVVGCNSGPVGRFPHGLFGNCKDCPTTCQSVDSCENCGDANCDRGQGCLVDPVPPSGAVAYPYYTIRGPRDFLARNPRSIGP